MANIPAFMQRRLISILIPDGEHAGFCAHTAQLGSGRVGTQSREQLVPKDGILSTINPQLVIRSPDVFLHTHGSGVDFENVCSAIQVWQRELDLLV